MRRFSIAMLIFILVAASGLAGVLAAAQIIQGEEVEQFLKRARFTARESLGLGVTHSLKVTLQQDGKTQYAVLKIVDQKRPGAVPNASGQIEIDFQDSWRTEVAAYEMDKLLGLGMVPATVERMSPYENLPASLQLWVEATMSEKDRREKSVIPPNPTSWSEQLSKMYLFDALIYNTDRNPGNLLITEDFTVRLIDHSRSFRPNAELRNKDDLTRFSRSLVAKIEQLNSSMLGKELGDYLSLTQLDGIMKRRQLLLDLVRDQVKELGEAAVFYQ